VQHSTAGPSRLFFFSVPGRSRRLKTLLGLLLFAAIAGAGIGCGSAANNPPKTPANPGTPTTTPPGSYIVTVSGTSGAITATTPVTITVN
jgi:trimeric autotransporter adhesin